jgi:hypothetical protein
MTETLTVNDLTFRVVRSRHFIVATELLTKERARPRIGHNGSGGEQGRHHVARPISQPRPSESRPDPTCATRYARRGRAIVSHIRQHFHNQIGCFARDGRSRHLQLNALQDAQVTLDDRRSSSYGLACDQLKQDSTERVDVTGRMVLKLQALG